MLSCPIVGVVDDAAVLVLGDLIPLHDPFDRGLAVDDVLVGFERYIRQRYMTVVNDGRLVDFLTSTLVGLTEVHLLHAVKSFRIKSEYITVLPDRIRFSLFIIQMDVCE